MKATGVVRRIDDLGRVVIPKEIRKTMRIKDGESLEFFLDSDNIVLKRYSPFENVESFYKSYVDSINSALENDVLIVDRDKIVAFAGALKKEYLGKTISNSIDKIIQDRTTLVKKENSDLELVTDKIIKASYVISPIIVRGDAIGAVVILSSKGRIDEFDEKTAIIAAKFLGKYIEE